ncbi:hypothetical protein BJV82DRAFT_593350 [Fennellomyces sp. T-0311]|nr:hypothetical protein BJV82DRAFT_593350 [Fennellomyces sp. T-0311]
MTASQTEIRSVRAFDQFIKTYHKDRYDSTLPLFPITVKYLRLFIDYKSKTCRFKAIQWLVGGLSKHPKHDKKWKEKVLGHPKVQGLLEHYRQRDKEQLEQLLQRRLEQRVPMGRIQKIYADSRQGFEVSRACVTSARLYNTGSTVTSCEQPRKRVTFAPVVEEVSPIKKMGTIELDIRRLASKVHINAHAVPVYGKQPIPIHQAAIPVGQFP